MYLQASGPSGTRRVPHVRLSVRGPMMIFFECFPSSSESFGRAFPDFLSKLVALMKYMRLSSRKGAHADLSGVAWQEIRVAHLFRPTYADVNMGHPFRLRLALGFLQDA
jgi:hypothetical protein